MQFPALKWFSSGGMRWSWTLACRLAAQFNRVLINGLKHTWRRKLFWCHCTGWSSGELCLCSSVCPTRTADSPAGGRRSVVGRCAVRRVRPHAVVAGSRHGLGVLSGAVPSAGTLAQRAGVHLLHVGPLSHREQPAGLLPLATKPLRRRNVATCERSWL